MSKARSRNQPRVENPTEAKGLDDALNQESFADLLPSLWRFRSQFKEGRDAEKVLKAALNLGLGWFAADEGCVATVRPGDDQATILFPSPADARWDRPMLAAFLRGEKVRVPPRLMLARIRRYGRMWGALAVHRSRVIITGTPVRPFPPLARWPTR